MRRKEYIQSAVVLVVAILIGLSVAYSIDKTNTEKKRNTSGDFSLGTGDLKVVSSNPSTGIIQSNTDSSLTGVPAQSVPETSNSSGSSLQNTGEISVPSSSGLQGSSTSNQQ